MAKKSAKKPAQRSYTENGSVKKAAKKSTQRSYTENGSVKTAPKKTSRYAKAKMNPVVHFEFPMDDPKRIAKFYSDAFGWKTIKTGKEHGGYLIVHTGETTADGMLKENGMINGGFYEREKRKPAKHPSVVIAVMDIEEAMQKIEEAGGEVIGAPTDIPGYGTYISFYDTEGNMNSIIEPDDKWKEKTSE